MSKPKIHVELLEEAQMHLSALIARLNTEGSLAILIKDEENKAVLMDFALYETQRKTLLDLKSRLDDLESEPEEIKLGGGLKVDEASEFDPGEQSLHRPKDPDHE